MKNYSLIYCDPPWRYDFAETKNRSIENQYPTMNIDDICALKVPSADNAVLYLWATAPKLVEAFRVIAAWGFCYKTHAIWDKEIIGMGYWFRGQHELLMVATKGHVSPPDQSERISSVIRHRREKHSRKPNQVRELLERWFPTERKLEMFARESHDGWDTFGNEVANSIIISPSPLEINPDEIPTTSHAGYSQNSML